MNADPADPADPAGAALARIEAAIARIESLAARRQASARMDRAAPDRALAERHERLRAEVADTLRQLDSLLVRCPQ